MFGNIETQNITLGCDMHSLHMFLDDNHPDCALTVFCKGTWVIDRQDEEQFRNALEEFVSVCNCTRETAEGYEVVNDFDTSSGVTTFYVMREDGTAMFDFPILFADAELLGEVTQREEDTK